ncbi:Bph1p [Ascoidea rubescens DSM 1968]|uniref:Beach-domain-containing protein n=1 Tax=Ascoidea rubescens DSM 1968 TaxID=1344418 RepID=A0A1D2V9X8_9ASCO|nr:beach-domain-containing protein [Ascoidea rubescens DSM 1968]ODV58345.1 beach-domain-containing protein [Ascoidea rubescens DSM 1968]
MLKSLPAKTQDNSSIELFINFKTDCVNSKSTIISTELTKYYRYLQDHQDNVQFFISNFMRSKTECYKVFFNVPTKRWILDYIESSDRMRKRIISEEYAVNDEKFSRKIEEFELIEDPGSFENTQEDKNRKILRSLFIGDRIRDLWNVSQILGLEAAEGILILGETHLYLIENYFHCPNGEVVDVEDAPPGSRDPYMQLIAGPSKSKETRVKNNRSHKSSTWETTKMISVSKRQFLLRDVALEIFFLNGSSFLITCRDTKERDLIYSKLSVCASSSGMDKDLAEVFRVANSSATISTNSNLALKLANAFTQNTLGTNLYVTRKWRKGQTSNFYYLMIVNTLAGRTFNDLTQYPIFPWVIADYTSEELDLNDPKTFRDLSKPMGAQNPQREAQFRERYEALIGMTDESAPPFHYGTHYSSAMIVTSFLIRLEPYVQSYLILQGGKFDHADRMFYSIPKAWNSASKDNNADVRELIPEFYYLDDFLTNSNNYKFGKLQNGESINNVELPPWAKGDPKIFIKKQREALESSYVSAHLNEWIDLVFGYKQRGQNAIDCTNVFHYLSYQGAIDLDKIKDENERKAMTGIIHNFGQTPLQVFTKPHPVKEVLYNVKLEIKKMLDIPVHVSESRSKRPIEHIELNHKDNCWKGRMKLFSTQDNLRIRGGQTVSSMSINGRVFEDIHLGSITSLAQIGNRMFLTGSNDGTINIWKYPLRGNLVGKEGYNDLNDGMKKYDIDLEFQGVLRGHLSSVVSIKVAPSYNLALSLDANGYAWLWDISRFKFIRKFSMNSKQQGSKFARNFKKIEQIAISNDSGMIAISGKSLLKLFTINGNFITEKKLRDNITSISFGNLNMIIQKPNGNTSISRDYLQNHEFWEDYQIVVTGGKKSIEAHELVVKDGSWSISKLRSFSFTQKDRGSNFPQSWITSIEMVLRSELNGDGERIGRGEIVAGDSKGRLAIWR